MAFEGLVAELRRLIRERVPGSQAKESVESFDSVPFLLKARFVSSSRTFGSRITEEYKDGQTIICDWEGQDLQVAVMMMPSANDWAQGRTKGEKFELWTRLLSYDTLYDRAIFGHALEEDADEQPPPESEPVSVEREPALVFPQYCWGINHEAMHLPGSLVIKADEATGAMMREFQGAALRPVNPWVQD